MTATFAPARGLSPAELLGVLRTLSRDASTWRALARHTADERWFLRLAAEAEYDTWLIGWYPGQGVDLHDHGGSAGALCVVEGELRETSTRRDGDARLRSRVLTAGEMHAFGRGHVHRVENDRLEPATSIHVYAPPLVTMDFYARDGDALTRTHRELADAPRNGAGELR